MQIQFKVTNTSVFTSAPLMSDNSFHQLLYLKKGKLQLWVSNSSFTLTHGHAIIISESVPFKIEYVSPEVKGIIIEFSTSVHADIRHGISVTVKPGDIFCRCADNLFGLSNHPSASEYVFLFSQKMVELSIHFFEKHLKILKKNPTIALREPSDIAKNFFDTRFSDDITVFDAARFCGISRNHLQSLFSTKFRISPKKYLLNKRIEEAKKLLELTSATSCEISSSVGFSSPQRFNEIFKNLTGMTPLQYRTNVNKLREKR